MAKKGIVASAVRTAVRATEKAIAPSPLAKNVIAAAAAEAIRQIEQRAPDMLASIEKKLRKNAGELAKPVDKALAAEKPPKRKSQKSARAKGGARKSAASRKTSKSSRGRASAGRKTARTNAGKKAAKSKRR